MDKQHILIIFPFMERANYFFKEQFEPYLNLKKISNYVYETDLFRFTICNFQADSLRGRKADFIYLSDDCDIRTYNELILPIVMSHDKIKVVI